MIGSIILIIISIFLAMNMGVSGFSVSFAPSYGSGVLKKIKAVFLYGICVFLGGTLIGPRVVETLLHKISLQDLNETSALLIISAAAITMFISNLLRIPQSTSFISVASFIGSGLFYQKVNWFMVGKILLVAIIFSLLSFIFTLLIKRSFYPPNHKNLRFYERFFVHREKFKKFIVFHDMYSAFGIGTNNVANVVAPIMGAISIKPVWALMLVAPFFGLGAFIHGEKVIKTSSKDIIPIGEMSATIISFITATFVIIASSLGLPTPYVQFTILSILAISCVKDGLRCTLDKGIFKRIVFVWIIVPIFTVLLSYILHLIFLTK